MLMEEVRGLHMRVVERLLRRVDGADSISINLELGQRLLYGSRITPFLRDSPSSTSPLSPQADRP